MSRDMKPRKKQPAKRSGGGSTVVGLFVGLVLGVAVAAGVVLYLNRAPLPFAERVQPPAKGDAAKPAASAPAAKPAAPATPAEPLALPGKPGDPVPEKRFQFYDILPGKADAVPGKGVPDGRRDEARKDEPKKDEVKESKTPLFLQAGSFSTAQDADNQKAKLAFMGYEALVQQVMIQDKTFYRVRVGPYTRLDELNKVRAELAKSGIEAQLSK